MSVLGHARAISRQSGRKDATVLAPEIEYHLCIFVNHEVPDGREEKQEERQGTAGPVFYNTSAFFVRFVTFVCGATPLQHKLREWDNQIRRGKILIIEYLNPFKQPCVLPFCSNNKSLRSESIRRAIKKGR